MKRIPFFCVLAFLGSPAPAAAQPVPVDSAGVHVVRTGDTLWDIAGRYLSDPFRWPQLFSANRDVVADPHWIFPDERLQIPGPAGAAAARPGGVGAPLAAAVHARTVFYAPLAGGARAGTSSVRPIEPDEVPAVPPGSFHAAGIIVPDTAFAPVGELLEVISPSVVDRRSAPQIQPYDRVTLRVLGAIQPGDRLQLLRRGQRVPPYGRVFQPTGSARVLEVVGGLATLEVDHFYDAVRPGDLALPMPAYAARPGVRPAPAAGIVGSLLAFRAGDALLATEDVGFVDLGRASGVVEGDEFIAYLPAADADTATAVEVARLQVIRAGRETSAVRVVALDQPALEAGLPVRIVARMP